MQVPSDAPEDRGDRTDNAYTYQKHSMNDRTPFGLKGVGYSFQRFMSRILEESNFVDAICYLDDVLVWGPTWDIFMSRIRLRKVHLEVLCLGAVIKNGRRRGTPGAFTSALIKPLLCYCG